MGRSYSDRQSPLSKRIKTGINPHRLLYFSNVWKRTGKMGSWWRTGFEVRSSLIQIDSIPAQHFAKFTTVDDCQRVEAVNARLTLLVSKSESRLVVIRYSSLLYLRPSRPLAVSTSPIVRPSFSRKVRKFGPGKIIRTPSQFGWQLA